MSGRSVDFRVGWELWSPWVTRAWGAMPLGTLLLGRLTTSDGPRTAFAAGPCLWVCRLDAALMLALVFLSEAPDPTRGPAAADHARELALTVVAR